MNEKQSEIFKNALGTNDGMILIDEISSKHEAHINEKLKEHDITYTQFKIILALKNDPKISQKELSEIYDLNESSITRLISKIEDKKLLETTKNPNNKRKKEIKITQKGRKLLEEVKIHEDKWNEHFKSNLRNDEIEELNKLLKKVKADRIRKTIFGTNYQIKRVEE